MHEGLEHEWNNRTSKNRDKLIELGEGIVVERVREVIDNMLMFRGHATSSANWEPIRAAAYTTLKPALVLAI